MKLNILIVEDEKDFLEELKLLLQIFIKKNYPMLNLIVDEAYNGKEALKLTKKKRL